MALDHHAAREQMVRQQLLARGIRAAEIIASFRRVPRHRFISSESQRLAYADDPVPIGAGQTISQPYIVAYMLEQAKVRRGERVLEIGTGCGYQTALLATLGCEVYSVERLPDLAQRARATLEDLGFRNIHFRLGDGTRGWREHAPYHAIIGSAAPAEIPAPLLAQLAPHGRLVLPVGRFRQRLVRVTRTASGSFHHEQLLAVRFVPMLSDRDPDISSTENVRQE